MDQTGRLILVGGVPVDLVFRVPELPRSGEDVLGSMGEYFAGGGYIVLYAAHQAGVRTSFGGLIGTGTNANLVRDALQRIGCEAVQRAVENADSTIVVVLVEPNGERSFVTGGNPDLYIRPQDLARIRPRTGDIIYLSGYEFTSSGRIGTIATWLSTVTATPVVCDLGPYGAAAGLPGLTALLPRMDWLSMNAAEALTFTETRDLCSAVNVLAEAAPQVGLLVRTGARGTLLKAPGGQPVQVPALVVDKVVDTNGAGDTHSGTFCAGLIRGLDPVAATWLANCAAGLSVTEFGSATAPPLATSQRFIMRSPTDPFG